MNRRVSSRRRNPQSASASRQRQSGGLRLRLTHPTKYEPMLPLPAADAAGLARPGLDPRVARLCVERIGMAPRQLSAGGAARFLGALMRYVSGNARLCGLGASSFAHHALRLHRLAVGIWPRSGPGRTSVSGPSRFGESRALERSRPMSSPARYSSASAAFPDIRKPVQSAAAIAFGGPSQASWNNQK